MKKLVDPLSAGGAPIFATETLSEVLTTEVWDAMQAILGSVTPSKYNALFATDNMVLSGGVPSDGGGGTIDFTAGIAYFPSAGGIIARFPAAVGVTPGFLNVVSIRLQTATTEQKTFFDSSSKDYTQTYTALINGPDTGHNISGYFLFLNVTNWPSLQQVFNGIETNRTAQLSNLGFSDIPIPPWDMNTTPSITVSIPSIASDTFISAEAWIRENDTASTRWRKLDWTDDGVYNGRVEIRGHATDEATAPIDALLFADAAGLFGTDAGFAGTAADRGKLKITYIYS